MDTESHTGAGKSAAPLTRTDIERLRSKVEHAAQLDLRLHNLRHCDLSFMDLQGANLHGADLQGSNLRGTNLSEADLQEANLSEADLDGADLSCAHLGDTAANRVKFHRARLCYATLRDLDLRGFDLSNLDLHNADLNGTDLRDAVLHGADLQGADLSTARLHGSELQGAILHRGAFWSGKGESPGRRKAARKPQAIPVQERSLSAQGHELMQLKQMLSEREAYLFGENALPIGFDPLKLGELFPQGFTFAQAHQLFAAWFAQVGSGYDEQARQAMWIGFAHRICDLYYENDAGS